MQNWYTPNCDNVAIDQWKKGIKKMRNELATRSGTRNLIYSFPLFFVIFLLFLVTLQLSH